MKRYNISKPRKFTDKQGNEKTYWDRVGEMVEFDNGNRLIKIPAIGLEANVFEDKPRESAAPGGAQADADPFASDEAPF